MGAAIKPCREAGRGPVEIERAMMKREYKGLLERLPEMKQADIDPMIEDARFVVSILNILEAVFMTDESTAALTEDAYWAVREAATRMNRVRDFLE